MTKTTASTVQNLRNLGLEVTVTDREGVVLEVAARRNDEMVAFAQWANGRFAGGYTVEGGYVVSHASLKSLRASADAL